MEKENCALLPLLVVDTDIAVHECQSDEWRKYGVDSVRVNSLCEAVEILSHSDEFLFIAINEDTIPDFRTFLPVVRNATKLPIFVISSSYTTGKKIEAMSSGADVYEAFSDNVQHNIIIALKALELYNRWAGQHPRKNPLLFSHGIVLSQACHQVFVNNMEIHMGKKEFSLLEYLMLNSGYVVTHAQLLEAIWGEGYTPKDVDNLWRLINRIKRKLSEVSPGENYIKVENSIGYKFLA